MQISEFPKIEDEPQSATRMLRPAMSALATKASSSAECIDADLGWREFLNTIGVSAAIISYAREGGDGGRQAFMVGFVNARTDRKLARSLVSYAEQIWQQAAAPFWPFRLSAHSPLGEMYIESPGPRSTDDDVPSQLREQFDHAAAARHVEPDATLQALLFRRRGDGDFSPECRQAIMRVLPLFIQSAGAYVAARREERRTAQLEAMFDKVSLATFLVDADARPIFCNDAARLMINERNWLFQGPDGTIGCTDSARSKELKVAIRSVATVGEFGSNETVLRLNDENGEWRLAFVIPAVSRFRDESSRCAMVLVHAPVRADASAQLLSALGLLPSEQRFLNSFLRSNSLSEAATETGVSDQTARTYLKRVRAKLGVHRQMDLAGLISGLVPPIRQRTPASAR